MGFIEGPNGEYDWCNTVHTSDTYVTPEDGIKHKNERQMKTYIVVR